jgi:small subunit ribosomal protein S4
MGLLERRLDNVVFRLNMAPSLRAARQMVSHGHVLLNGKRADISSIILEPGAKISLTDKGYENQNYLQAKQSPRLEVPDFLRKEEEAGKEVGTVQSIPGLEQVPFSFDPGLFTEYYAARNV